MNPPSRRTALRPSSLPSGSTSGPPDEPRGSGAVCSIEPATRRPRGPRKPRPVALTRPNVVRRPRPPGLASASTAAPASGGSSPGSHVIGVTSAVSTAITATSRSGSTPATRPSAVRPSANATATSSPRSTCATVSTWPGANHARPAPPPAAETHYRRSDPRRRVGDRLLDRFKCFVHFPSSRVTCNLQVTIHGRLFMPTNVNCAGWGGEGAGRPADPRSREG